MENSVDHVTVFPNIENLLFSSALKDWKSLMFSRQRIWYERVTMLTKFSVTAYKISYILRSYLYLQKH